MLGERFARKIATRIERYGQTITAHFDRGGERCPCFDPVMGYSAPQYHRDHPDAPACNDDGMLASAAEEVEFKGLALPADELHEAQLGDLGEILSDDHVLYYPGDVDLDGAASVQYAGKRYIVRNADEYRVEDTVVCSVAVMRLLA